MSHRRGSLGGLNIHQAAGATKPVALQKRSRVARAAGQVLVQAMACGLSSVEARALVACNIQIALGIVAEPHREAEIRRKADLATVNVVRRARLRWLEAA